MSESPSAPAETSIEARRYAVTRKVTLIGTAVDAGLGALKLVAGWFAQSQALIADGVHSLSDLATDLIVIIAARKAGEEADEDHPYGHGRFETLATVVLGLSLIAVGAGLAFDAVRRMLEPELLLTPAPWAIWAAVVSVFAKEAIYQYTIRQARKIRSKLLEANAWHSRSDAISSLVVIAGLLGTMAGLEYVDAVAAIVVAWMIGRIGWDFALHSVRELVDTGLDEETVASIRETIMTVDGVGALHELRTRRMGSSALVDVHIILANPRVSVSEGHQLSEAVRHRVMQRIDDIADVMVHIDPEDDEIAPVRIDLPSRAKLEPRLHEAWLTVEGWERVEELALHYLGGRVHVEVRVAGHAFSGANEFESFQRALAAKFENDADVGNVSVVGVFDDR